MSWDSKANRARDPGRIGGSEKEERDVRVCIAAPSVSAGCAALYGGIDDAPAADVRRSQARTTLGVTQTPLELASDPRVNTVARGELRADTEPPGCATGVAILCGSNPPFCLTRAIAYRHTENRGTPIKRARPFRCLQRPCGGGTTRCWTRRDFAANRHSAPQSSCDAT